MEKHKIFISYHHDNDQWYKNELLKLNATHNIFIDQSVHTGSISDDLPDERIREKIRDEFLKDSTVTIVLIGTETKLRKHIDWEIYSSMYDGKVNKKSGILCINLPTLDLQRKLVAGHSEENLYPEHANNWTPIKTIGDCISRNPYLPERIADNIVHQNVKLSVTNWEKIIQSPDLLKKLIEMTFRDRENCKYDLSRQMKRKNEQG